MIPARRGRHRLLRRLSAIRSCKEDVNASLVLGESTGSELRQGNTARLARRLVMTYAGCLGYLREPQKQPAFFRPRPEESLVALSLRALSIQDSAEIRAALNAVMIWCADHELRPRPPIRPASSRPPARACTPA